LDEKGLPEKENAIQVKWLDNEKTGDLVPVNWIKKKLGMVLISFHMKEIK